MIIIHGIKTIPRLVGAALSERLRVMPAVVVIGARQTGIVCWALCDLVGVCALQD